MLIEGQATACRSGRLTKLASTVRPVPMLARICIRASCALAVKSYLALEFSLSSHSMCEFEAFVWRDERAGIQPAAGVKIPCASTAGTSTRCAEGGLHRSDPKQRKGSFSRDAAATRQEKAKALRVRRPPMQSAANPFVQSGCASFDVVLFKPGMTAPVPIPCGSFENRSGPESTKYVRFFRNAIFRPTCGAAAPGITCSWFPRVRIKDTCSARPVRAFF